MLRCFVEGMILGLLCFIAFTVYAVAWEPDNIIARAYVYQMMQPNQVAP